MKKKLQLVAVATDKHKIGQLSHHSDVWLIIEENSFLANNPSQTQYWAPHHLYLLSDEEIKEGDWVFRPTDNIILKCTANMLIAAKQLGLAWNQQNRKIVATTNPALLHQLKHEILGTTVYEWISGIAKLPQSLMQEWVKRQGKMDSVVVEYQAYDLKRATVKGVKQPTPFDDPNYIESFPVLDCKFRPKLTPSGEIIWSPVEEKMYDRDELIFIAYECYKYGIQQGINPTTKPFHEWFDKNYPE